MLVLTLYMLLVIIIMINQIPNTLPIDIVVVTPIEIILFCFINSNKWGINNGLKLVITKKDEGEDDSGIGNVRTKHGGDVGIGAQWEE